MTRFPGVATRATCSGHPFVLTDEQKAWLVKWFPTIENKRLVKASGLSEGVIHRLARKLGLKKSEKGLHQIMKRQSKVCKRTCEKNGYYYSLRGRQPSEATKEGTRKMWQDIREGKREHPFKVLKKMNPKKYKAFMANKSKERSESIRKEKLRMMYGLERKTRLKTVVLVPYKRSQIAHRFAALRRGYLLDEDCREGQPGRYVIYYNDQTERSEIFERNCIKDGFRFERDV